MRLNCSKLYTKLFFAMILIFEKILVLNNKKMVNVKTYFAIYLPRILLTQPFDTCKIRDISHGRAPECASSTIFCLVESGSGRPPTNTPPS
jgi:hypothetical protein